MNKRVFAIALFVSLGLASSLIAQTVSSRPADSVRAGSSAQAASAPSPRLEAHAARALLSKRIENVDWVDAPFEDVIEWLKTEGEGRVNVVPRWGQLNVESVDTDTPLTLQLNNTTVANVLTEALESISPDGELAFHAVGNNLRISTKADFDRKMYVRVYNVTDILFMIEDHGETAPVIDLQQTRSGAGGGGGGQSVFAGGSGGNQQGRAGEQAEQEFQDRLDDLSEKLQQIIAPESWDTGQVGGRGKIVTINRALVVYNTIEVHEQIAGFFAFGE
jgi:hypothetical protein